MMTGITSFSSMVLDTNVEFWMDEPGDFLFFIVFTIGIFIMGVPAVISSRMISPAGDPGNNITDMFFITGLIGAFILASSAISLFLNTQSSVPPGVAEHSTPYELEEAINEEFDIVSQMDGVEYDSDNEHYSGEYMIQDSEHSAHAYNVYVDLDGQISLEKIENQDINESESSEEGE